MLYDPFSGIWQVTANSDRGKAILWARSWLREGFVILDTETTGFRSEDEAVSIAVVDESGEVLLDTLLCHTKPSEPDAIKIHGHTWESTRDAPTFVEVWPWLMEIIQDKEILIYNAAFDIRIIKQMIQRYGIDTKGYVFHAHCVMKQFTAFVGRRKLTETATHFGIDADGAHRAVTDALMTLGIVRRMSRTEDEP